MYMMELTRLIIFHEMLMNWDNSIENLCKRKERITKTTTIPFGKLWGNVFLEMKKHSGSLSNEF